MSKNKKFLSVLLLLAITPVAVLMPQKTASAKSWPTLASLDVAAAACAPGSAQYPELARLHDGIAGAASLDEARALALAPMADAIDALDNARSIMPFSDDLRVAENRLGDARSRINDADTPEQVADEFSGMMLAGLDSDRAAHVNVGKVGCDYSSGELIAIVVGLILGIIPGLILLVVLC